MSNINLNNYEAFFLDYVEQRLSAEEVAELLLFLEQHPDLKQELEEYEEIQLPEEHIDHSFKSKLPELSGLINELNCEDYFIGAVEGILTANERKELDLFLNLNPHYQSDYDLYQQTRLPIEDMPYPNIEKLLLIAQKGMYVDYPGKEKRRRGLLIWLPAYTYIAAAASVALLIGFWYFFSSPQLYHDQPALVQIINPGSETVQPGSGSDRHRTASSQALTMKSRVNRVPVKRNTNQGADKALAAGLGRKSMPVMQTLLVQELKEANNSDAPESGMSMQTVPASAPSGPENQAQEEYQSLGAYAANRVAPDVTDEVSSDKADKHLGLAITRLAARAFNRVSGRKIKIKENYNDKGVLVSYAINTGNFEYARAVNK
jgi:hypothetical protein